MSFTVGSHAAQNGAPSALFQLAQWVPDIPGTGAPCTSLRTCFVHGSGRYLVPRGVSLHSPVVLPWGEKITDGLRGTARIYPLVPFTPTAMAVGALQRCGDTTRADEREGGALPSPAKQGDHSSSKEQKNHIKKDYNFFSLKGE